MNNLMVIDGIEVRRDAYGRYSLNDLHRAAGGEQKKRPKYWLSNKQTCELIEQLFTEGGIPPLEKNQPVSVINGGNNQGDVCLQRTGVCLCNVDQPVIPSEGDPYFRYGNQRIGKIIRAGC